MIPGQITVPPVEPTPTRYACAECEGPVVVLPDAGVMPRPCGHNAARVRAYVSATCHLVMTARHGEPR